MSAEHPTSEPATASAATASTEGATPAADGAASELEQARAEVAAAKDQLLRVHAEMENVRRRAAREVEAANKFGQEKLLGALVPVVDNLERAAASAATVSHPEIAAIAEGVELSVKLFADTLARFGVEPIDPLGQPFDPKFHQAVSMIESPTMEPNSVLQVLQKGYSLNGRLVRPAMVIVARSAAPRVDERA